MIIWLFEPDSFAPIARIDDAGAQSVLTDHLGTPITVVDTHGQPTWQGNINSFGGMATFGDPSLCPFRFAGQYEDGEIGLCYNRFRYYDPSAGVYLSRDPLGLRGGWMPYGYVGDPTREIDPFGLAAEPGVGCGKAEAKTSTALTNNPWLPNGGVLGNSWPQRLEPGTRVDRYGYPGGSYVSPEGTPYPQRALHPSSKDKPYCVYEVLEPIDVETGIVAPWFGEPGMGLQHELPTSVSDLLRLGKLLDVTP